MELLQLTYFCDAAITQNFSKTAEKYKVPPSNISQSIKRLEKELSVSLFDRQANRVFLNERGKAFYAKAKTAMDLLESARLEAMDENHHHQLRLAIHVNRRIVMQAVERFHGIYPNVSILMTYDQSNLQDMDFIISANSFILQEFSKEKLFCEDVLLAAHKDLLQKDLTSEESLTAANLQHLPFITMSAGNSLRTLTEEICNHLGFHPHIALQSEDPFYIRKCVELGLGISFIPAISWKNQFSQNVVLYRVGDYNRNIFLYRKKLCVNKQYAEAFCTVLMEVIQKEQD